MRISCAVLDTTKNRLDCFTERAGKRNGILEECILFTYALIYNLIKLPLQKI